MNLYPNEVQHVRVLIRKVLSKNSSKNNFKRKARTGCEYVVGCFTKLISGFLFYFKCFWRNIKISLRRSYTTSYFLPLIAFFNSQNHALGFYI